MASVGPGNRFFKRVNLATRYLENRTLGSWIVFVLKLILKNYLALEYLNLGSL